MIIRFRQYVAARGISVRTGYRLIERGIIVSFVAGACRFVEAEKSDANLRAAAAPAREPPPQRKRLRARAAQHVEA